MNMGRIESVEEFLRKKNLSPEELETHRELISECLKREACIRKSGEETRNNLERLSETFSLILKKLEESGQILGEIELRSIPERDFYKE
jgi:hypothetical protein